MELNLPNMMENEFAQNCFNENQNHDYSFQNINKQSIESMLLLQPQQFNLGIYNQSNCNYDQEQQNKLQYYQNDQISTKSNTPIICPEPGEQFVPSQQLPISRWSREECQLYEIFITEWLNKSNNESGINGKRNKNFFSKMHEFIGTRTVTQCRSHHQKFFKKIVNKLGLEYEQLKENYKSDQESCKEEKPKVKKLTKQIKKSCNTPKISPKKQILNTTFFSPCIAPIKWTSNLQPDFELQGQSNNKWLGLCQIPVDRVTSYLDNCILQLENCNLGTEKKNQ